MNPDYASGIKIIILLRYLQQILSYCYSFIFISFSFLWYFIINQFTFSIEI